MSTPRTLGFLLPNLIPVRIIKPVLSGFKDKADKLYLLNATLAVSPINHLRILLRNDSNYKGICDMLVSWVSQDSNSDFLKQSL